MTDSPVELEPDEVNATPALVPVEDNAILEMLNGYRVTISPASVPRESIVGMRRACQLADVAIRVIRGEIDDLSIPAILLTGPVGTGKSLLCRYVASRTGDVAETFLVPMSRVSPRLFDVISREWRNDKRRLLILDESDQTVRRRDQQADPSVLYAMLSYLDGVNPVRPATTLMLTTNTSTNFVDQAVSRRCYVISSNLPSFEELCEITRRSLASHRTRGQIDVEAVAHRLGSRAAPYEAVAICLRALTLGIAENDPVITQGRLLEAVSEGRIIRDDPELSPETRAHVVCHEASHAIVSRVLNLPVRALSLSRRLGLTQYATPEIVTESYMRNQIVASLAGQEGELLILGERMLGSDNDLGFSVTAAMQMQREGLADPGIGASFLQRSPDLQNLSFRGVLTIIDECRSIARDLVMRYKGSVIALAELLDAEESISGSRLNQVLDEVMSAS